MASNPRETPRIPTTLDGAQRCVRKALKLAGSDCALRLAAGTELAELGDADGARFAFERILDFEPDNADALEALGLMLLEFWPREAAAVRERLVEVDPDRTGARVALDSAFVGTGGDVIDFDYEGVSRIDREPISLTGVGSIESESQQTVGRRLSTITRTKGTKGVS